MDPFTDDSFRGNSTSIFSDKMPLFFEKPDSTFAFPLGIISTSQTMISKSRVPLESSTRK